MPVRPDRLAHKFLGTHKKRIVERNRAIVTDAVNLAVGVIQILRRRIEFLCGFDTHRKIHMPLIIEGDASTRTGIRRRTVKCQGRLPDCFNVRPATVNDVSAVKSVHRRFHETLTTSFAAKVRVMEVDPPVFFIIRMGGDIQQPA